VLKEFLLSEIDGILYAGLVGSHTCRSDAEDIDVTVIVDYDLPPTIRRLDENVSALILGRNWLTYKKHAENPTGLVPSILFKSIKLSKPIIGNKDAVKVPRIKASDADYINIEVKKRKYADRDRKNYLVAIMFEKLLTASPTLDKYHFDNIRLAKELRLPKIAQELNRIHKLRMTAKA